MAYIKEGEERGGAHPFTKPNMIQSLVSFDMSTRPKFWPHNLWAQKKYNCQKHIWPKLPYSAMTDTGKNKVQHQF
jgi:hypothetical protein